MKRFIGFLFVLASLIAVLCFSSCGECKHKWQAATCTKPKTCTVCGKTEGKTTGHKWQAATCTKPKTCSVCGKTEGKTTGHKWQAATCTTPKTCTVCGKAEGSALGHTWQNATCTKPKTCTRCKRTEGTVSTTHTFSSTWSSDTTYHWHAATCTHQSETSGRAEHTYNADKTCTVCGYKDVRLAVNVIIDGKTVDTLYTSSEKKFRIQAPERPEDIMTNPNSQKYFYGWFVDPNFQTPLFDTTEFRKDGAIYGKWVTVYSNNFVYTVSQGVATITGFKGRNVTVLVVPAYVNGFPVKYIARKAFKDNTMLRTVIFCDGIEIIGSDALSGCNSITKIELPDSIREINDAAFSSCLSLTDIRIPNSVTSIGRYAFYGCTGLTSITIPSSVTSIGGYAFYGCTGLTSITIPSSVTSIGQGAFSGCSGLKEVHISDIAAWCKISFCSGENPLIYAHNLYLNDTLVTELTIPNSVTSIGEYAFYGCTGLTSVTIQNGVTSIGEYAFYGCTGLKSITIPNSVTGIGEWAFGYNLSLNIYYTGSRDEWNNISYGQSGYIGEGYTIHYNSKM